MDSVTLSVLDDQGVEIIHSSLGYLSPNDYAKKLKQAA